MTTHYAADTGERIQAYLAANPVPGISSASLGIEPMRKWWRIAKVPERVPVRDKRGRLWQRAQGRLWTLSTHGAWYTPASVSPSGRLAEVENPGWWLTSSGSSSSG